jgi:hypothetical protein
MQPERERGKSNASGLVFLSDLHNRRRPVNQLASMINVAFD